MARSQTQTIDTYTHLEDVVLCQRGITTPIPATYKMLPFAVFSLLVLTLGHGVEGTTTLTLGLIALLPFVIMLIGGVIYEKLDNKNQDRIESEIIAPFLNTAKPQKFYLMTTEMEDTIKEHFSFLNDPKEVFAYWYEPSSSSDDTTETKDTLRILLKSEAKIRGIVDYCVSPNGEDYMTAIVFENSLTDNYREGLYRVTKYTKE